MHDVTVESSDGKQWVCLEPSNYAALLRILIRRATLVDRWRAWRKPGHWLNRARREALTFGGTESTS